MKALFIGGTGTISQAVSQLAVDMGIELYLLNRGNQNELAPEGAEIIKGDIHDVENTAEILKGYQFDVVVDWIVFTPGHLKKDIELFRDKTGQYIFISSASAYQKPQTHYRITESTPLANPYWEYSRNKIACEDILREEYRKNAFPFTIVRPSHTYGKTAIPAALNSSKSPWSLVDRMRRGKKVIVHGDGSSLWVMTHNTDFAKAFVGLMGNQKAIAHAFHITSDEVLNWNQIYDAIAKAAGVEADIIHIPSEYLGQYSDDMRGSLLGDKTLSCVFDNTKIKEFVPDFCAVVPFTEGIKKSVDWFESNLDYCEIDKQWNSLMDTIIKDFS